MRVWLIIRTNTRMRKNLNALLNGKTPPAFANLFQLQFIPYMVFQHRSLPFSKLSNCQLILSYNFTQDTKEYREMPILFPPVGKDLVNLSSNSCFISTLSTLLKFEIRDEENR